jgi:IclR family acetate operon transcriptional repressor
MPTGEPYPGTQSVLRAIALLKTFSDEQPELGLADLSRLVGLNKTTTYRLLTALESEGMVVRNADTETFRLGPEIIALGGRAMRANDLRLVSRAELERLAEAVGEAATLEVLADSEVLILEEISGSHLVSTNQAIGTRWPAHATSTGKLIVAHLPEAELDEFLRQPLARLTEHTITDPTQLRLELTRIREQGYAVADQEIEIGFIAIGAPVRNHEGQVVGAISINGPTARLTSDRIPDAIRRVKFAADHISGLLGCRPDGEL